MRALIFGRLTYTSQTMELLQHVNSRVKSMPEAQLPVKDLVTELCSPTVENKMFSNFAIIYIEMGFGRLPKDGAMPLVPMLLKVPETLHAGMRTRGRRVVPGHRAAQCGACGHTA